MYVLYLNNSKLMFPRLHVSQFDYETSRAMYSMSIDRLTRRTNILLLSCSLAQAPLSINCTCVGAFRFSSIRAFPEQS